MDSLQDKLRKARADYSLSAHQLREVAVTILGEDGRFPGVIVNLQSISPRFIGNGVGRGVVSREMVGVVAALDKQELKEKRAVYAKEVKRVQGQTRP